MPTNTPAFKPVKGTEGYDYYSDMETLQKGLMTVQASRRCEDVSMAYMRDGHSCGLRMAPAEARALAASLLAAADASDPPESVLSEQDARYALNRSVPDMSRGFSIQTNYGDLVVPAGWLADRIATVTAAALQLQLSAVGVSA